MTSSLIRKFLKNKVYENKILIVLKNLLHLPTSAKKVLNIVLRLCEKTLDEISTPFNNMMELYFEDFDIDGLLVKYESGKYFIQYATELTEFAGSQKLVRLYDPSGNLIEVRTPLIGNSFAEFHENVEI